MLLLRGNKLNKVSQDLPPLKLALNLSNLNKKYYKFFTLFTEKNYSDIKVILTVVYVFIRSNLGFLSLQLPQLSHVRNHF